MSYSIDPREAVAHLQPATWEKVNCLQIRKMIAEFAHEQIITPAFEYAKEGCMQKRGVIIIHWLQKI